MGEHQLSPAQQDRAVGAVIGSAAGDALGSAYEFGPALADGIVPEFGVGHFGHAAGEWTDDTSMAVPLLEVLATGRSLTDPKALEEVVGRWVEWSRTAKDVGIQTSRVFERLGESRDEGSARAAAESLHLETGRSAGNGSLMRTGPVALGYLGDGEEPGLVEAASRVARLTHWEESNVDAVVLWCLAIRHSIRTGGLDLRAGLEWIEDSRCEEWDGLIAQAVAPGAHPRDFQTGNGWVVRAFQAAASAVAHAHSLTEALQRAVRGGGDTDTVAAIAGSLAGARWGGSQLPPAWRDTLHGWPGLTCEDLKSLVQRAVSPTTAGRRSQP